MGHRAWATQVSCATKRPYMGDMGVLQRDRLKAVGSMEQEKSASEVQVQQVQSSEQGRDRLEDFSAQPK